MTINLGSTATDKSIKIKPVLRVFMMISATVLLLIEISIAVNKLQAALFASAILIAGLSARAIAKSRAKVPVPALQAVPAPIPAAPPKRRRRSIPSTKYLLALKDVHEKLIRFAIDEAKSRNAFLFILRLKEIAVGALAAQLDMPTNGQEQWIDRVCAEAGIEYQSVLLGSLNVSFPVLEIIGG